MNRQKSILHNLAKSFLFVGFISLCAWLSSTYYFQSDWTSNNRNSLSDDSRALIESLEQPVSITAYVTTNAQLRKSISSLIDRYRKYKKDITLEFVDPALNPQTLNALNLNPEGEILIKYNQDKEKLRTVTEHSLSNALLRLSGSKDRWVVFLHGHGERSPERPGNQDLSQLANTLTGRGLHVQTLELSQTKAIPDNTSVLVIAGPRTVIPDDEAKLITDYIARGGNLLWLADPDNHQRTGSLSESVGIEILPGTIISAKTHTFSIKNPSIIVIKEHPNKHAITNGIEQPILFPFACGIRLKPNKNWSSTQILTTSAQSWTETGDLQQPPLRFDPQTDEHRGPVTLGVAMTRNTTPQRVVVICDGDFLSNAFLLNGDNRAFANNMVHWLSHDEKFININPDAAKDTHLQLNNFANTMISFVFPFLIPALLIIAGIFIRYRRNRM